MNRAPCHVPGAHLGRECYPVYQMLRADHILRSKANIELFELVSVRKRSSWNIYPDWSRSIHAQHQRLSCIPKYSAYLQHQDNNTSINTKKILWRDKITRPAHRGTYSTHTWTPTQTHEHLANSREPYKLTSTLQTHEHLANTWEPCKLTSTLQTQHQHLPNSTFKQDRTCPFYF